MPDHDHETMRAIDDAAYGVVSAVSRALAHRIDVDDEEGLFERLLDAAAHSLKEHWTYATDEWFRQTVGEPVPPKLKTEVSRLPKRRKPSRRLIATGPVPSGPAIFQTCGHHLLFMWADPINQAFQFRAIDCDAWYDAEAECRHLRRRLAAGTDPASVALRDHYSVENLLEFLHGKNLG